MNKTLIALSLAFAASTGTFTAAQAEDGFQRGPNISGQPNFVAGVVTDYGNTQGYEAKSGVDYTATASVDRNEKPAVNVDFLYGH